MLNLIKNKREDIIALVVISLQLIETRYTASATDKAEEHEDALDG